jgi:hypothetical protein
MGGCMGGCLEMYAWMGAWRWMHDVCVDRSMCFLHAYISNCPR